MSSEVAGLPHQQDVSTSDVAEEPREDATAATSRTRTSAPSTPSTELLELEGEYAADYVEGLLDILDLDGDIDMDVEGSRAVVAVVGSGLESLIGDRGQVLEAVQELTRLAVQRRTGTRSRLMLDIGGYRARKRAELTQLGAAVAERVQSSGKPERLAPMSAFERKVVHDEVARNAGVRSESEGEEPNRRVVVLPS